MIRRGARPTTQYLVVANAVVCDRRLSFAATGLLVHLLSKPDHWQVSVANLSNEALEGRDKIRKLLGELIDAGYCVRESVRNPEGKITGTDYTIFDEPVDPETSTEAPVDPGPEKPGPANPAPVKPAPANPTQESKEDKKVTTSESNQSNTPAAKVCGFDFSAWPTAPSESVLKDWVKVRMAKKAPLTQTAVDRLTPQIAEASMHGYTADDCLGLAAERGWRGFKCDWLLNDENSKQQHQSTPRGQTPPQGLTGGKQRTRDVSAMDVATDMGW